MHRGLIWRIRVGELPLHLRRNLQHLGKRVEPLEKFEPFLRRHREADPQPSGVLDQIRPDERNPATHRAQSPFKPARREHGFPKPHQRMVANTARAEGRIGRIEGLEVERIETQVLLEFRGAGLTVGPVGIHPGDQFRSTGTRVTKTR